MKLFKSKEEKRLEHEKRIKYVEENWENMTDEERQHENFIWPAYRDWETDRKSTRLNSSHSGESRMPSSA